jgi:CRP/FNR family cyclic AMP-dependent transcriptional regulator
MTHDILASIPLFSALDADERRDLLRLAEPFSFPAGHVIFEQGDLADGMYVLERGRVRLWARLLGEEQVALAEVAAGDVLGEFALIDRGARSASAEVLDPAHGYFFSHRRFELLRADHRTSARKMMRELRLSLCQRLRAASTELAESSPAFYEHTQRMRTTLLPDGSVRSPASELDPKRLRMLPLFAQFSVVELRSLLERLSILTLPRGHVLFSDGDPGGSAFVTVRGAVEVIAGSSDKRRRQAILGPGRLFGLVAPLDGGLRESSAAIREDAIVLEIPPAELEAHLQTDDPTSGKLIDAMHAALSEALRATNRTLLTQSAMGRASHRKKRTLAPGVEP